MSRFLRASRITLAVLGCLLLAGILILFVIFYRALPIYAGQKVVPGMLAEVHIVRDEHGVPHIFASSMNDAARALGYVHASERLFQMEMNRRAGQGRLAEVLGSDMLSIDQYTRTLGLYHLAESSFTTMSPEAQSYFLAYADGVNAWLEAHRHALPPEFLALQLHPDPWRPADSLVWGKLMALQLSHNYRLESLRAELSGALTRDQMQALFPPIGNTPVTMDPQLTQTGALTPRDSLIREGQDPARTAALKASVVLSASDQLAKFTALDHAASNEWVIAGRLTESGKPILANDPHLGLEAPVLWYLARLVTPELTIEGATVPGLPVVLLGQNDHIAWGFTTTGSDVEDLFLETLDPHKAGHYLTPQGSLPFQQRTEIIHVKGAPDVALAVRLTRHGPVLSDIDPQLEKLAGKSKVMALAFTGLSDRDTTSEALMRMNKAANWNEFLTALRLYQAPPQNVAYADTAGHIGFINPGLLPIRKSGNGLLPADGSSGLADWSGYVPFDQMPRLLDPPAGFVFNANNAVNRSGQTPYLGTDWEEPYRAERLQTYFNVLGKHSLETSATMQADHLSLAARELLPYLLKVEASTARAAKALDMLKSWDGTMDKDRPEPLIFEAWLSEMHRLLLVEKVGVDLKPKGPISASSMTFILAHAALNWCEDPGCPHIMAEALDRALELLTERDGQDMKSWRWGEEHVALLQNKFFSHIPVLRDISDLAVPSSGDFYTLDRGGSFDNNPSHPFARTHGGGFRGLYDLADPARSRFMIATGQSGQIFSRHYGDLVALWNDVKSFTLTGSETVLRARGLPVLILTPSIHPDLLSSAPPAPSAP